MKRFIEFFTIIFLIIFAGCVISRNHKRIMEIGETAEALVVDVSDTGVSVNLNPKVRLILKVYPKSGQPYIASVSQVVSRVTIPRVGDRVTVKYDPDDPTNVIIPYKTD